MFSRVVELGPAESPSLRTWLLSHRPCPCREPPPPALRCARLGPESPRFQPRCLLGHHPTPPSVRRSRKRILRAGNGAGLPHWALSHFLGTPFMCGGSLRCWGPGQRLQMPCPRGPGQRGRAGEVVSSAASILRGPLCSPHEGCPPASSRPDSGTKRLRCGPAQSPPGRHGARAAGKVSEHSVPACLSPRSHMLADGSVRTPADGESEDVERLSAARQPPPPPTGEVDIAGTLFPLDFPQEQTL